MPTATHAHGLPAWVEVSAEDVNGQLAFYGKLFGLDTDIMDGGGMPYGMLLSGDKHAAGVMPKMNPGQPIAWLIYFGTDDINETVKLIEANGGTVWIPPSPIPGPEGALFSVASSPDGAPFGLLQSTLSVFSDFGEPGFPAWFELQSRGDIDAEGAFFAKVFGWQVETMTNTPEMHYLTWGLTKEQPFGGIFDMKQYLPEGVPSHWATYFTVADADATAAKAVELGGKVIMSVQDSPYGRMGTLADPEGGVFIILKPEGNGQV